MILLTLVMALASALLPNVVSVPLIAPVTLRIRQCLAINPVPLLMAEVFASSSRYRHVVGDPPNIIGARSTPRSTHSVQNMAPIVIIIMLVFAGDDAADVCRGLSTVDGERIADVMAVDEREARGKPPLLIKCGAVMVLVFAGF